MIQRLISEPIEFVDNGRINVQKLKQEIDRRIVKVGNLCLLASYALKDLPETATVVRIDSMTQTIDAETKKVDHATQIIIEPLDINPDIISKKDPNSDRPTIEENPDSENDHSSSDEEKKEIEKSRDSKFFSDSNLQLQKLITASKMGESMHSGSECIESTGDLLHNISMKSSCHQPLLEINNYQVSQKVTPSKTLMKHSTIVRSSMKSPMQLFNSAKKSNMCTSFIEDDLMLKREPLSNYNRGDLKKSQCEACVSRSTYKVSRTERLSDEKLYVSQGCKDKMQGIITELASKPMKQANENKVRENLLKRIAEKSFVGQAERNN